MKEKLKFVKPVICMALVLAIIDYIFCPAWNIHYEGFWFMWMLVFLTGTFASVPMWNDLFGVRVRGRRPNKSPKKKSPAPGKEGEEEEEEKEGATVESFYLHGGVVTRGERIFRRILLAGFVLPILIIFLGRFFSGKLFHARAYSAILNVQDGVTEDFPNAESTSSIALMDTQSAAMLGNREIGSLSHVVSQYDVFAEDYVQVNIHNSPMKVAPLGYASIFKWYANRKNGVPGYVTVDPVSMSASYKELEEGMRFVPSAYFHEDLMRHVRWSYRSDMFWDIHFETDEEGKAWYVAPVYEHSIFLFGGTRITGAVLIDPVTGAMEKKAVPDVPDWVDVVYPGDLICVQYNNYAQLQKGFWNSVIGQIGCRRVTTRQGSDQEEEGIADFGYIAKESDIWIYTGVTSVNGDSSNIGFIMSNERTGETRYIPCSGADEFSAMSAAEGEVQEKRYQASFPSLIQMDGIPTYIMVLKDNAGLVKMYACVNVEQYNIVATSARQADCVAKYKALVAGDITGEQANSDTALPGTGAPADTSSWEKKNLKISRMVRLDVDGTTYLYIWDGHDRVYHARLVDVLDLAFASEGDTVSVLTDGENFLLAEQP